MNAESELAQLRADFRAQGVEPTPQLLIWALAGMVASMRHQRSAGFVRLPPQQPLAIEPKTRPEAIVP